MGVCWEQERDKRVRGGDDEQWIDHLYMLCDWDIFEFNFCGNMFERNSIVAQRDNFEGVCLHYIGFWVRSYLAMWIKCLMSNHIVAL